MEFTLSNGNQLELQPGLSSSYLGPILKGASAYHGKSNFSELQIQELNQDYYNIRYVVGKFLKKIHATGWIHQPGLYTHFMLKNGIRKQVDSVGRFHIRQDHHACFLTEPGDCSALFERSDTFIALELYYSPLLFQDLAPFFPDFKAIYTSSQGILLPDTPAWTPFPIRETIHQLLHCPYDVPTSRFYFDLKVKEMLFLLLGLSFNPDKIQQKFTPFETVRIYKARDILETYLAGKPPTLKQLSHEVGMNQFKLKLGFRKYFNLNPFDWLQHRKMENAKELLLHSNKPIKEIGAMVGFKRTTNFTTAFRKRYGITPGQIRRS